MAEIRTVPYAMWCDENEEYGPIVSIPDADATATHRLQCPACGAWETFQVEVTSSKTQKKREMRGIVFFELVVCALVIGLILTRFDEQGSVIFGTIFFFVVSAALYFKYRTIGSDPFVSVNDGNLQHSLEVYEEEEEEENEG